MSSSSSDSEVLPVQQVQHTYSRNTSRRRKRYKASMTLEQFGKYSDYAEKKKKYDPQSSREKESSLSNISDESDPDCLCWEVASRRIRHYKTFLNDVFKEVAQLREENKRLKEELQALKKSEGDS